MERETFEDFCSRMHQEHMYSRPRNSNYTEFGKPYNEYVLSNLNFLYNEYERQKSKQTGKTVDELNRAARLHSM